MKTLFGTVVTTLALLAISPRLGAQELRPQGGGESYGPGANSLVIPASAFVPELSTGAYTTGGDGYLYGVAGAGNTQLRAGVELPAGARVVNVCGFTNDLSSGTNAAVRWEAREMGDTDAAPHPAVLGIGATSPGGTPGYGLTCVDLAVPTVIRKLQDLNGDSFGHYTWYFVGAGVAGQVGFGGAVVTWLRQVSPAPGVATFVDVPTNFLYFRAIEALNASGITQGCGAGNYCPNLNVTRGEMAAFLARALGLHWPL